VNLHRFAKWFVVFAVLVLFPASCSRIIKKGPPEVVKAFFAAANDGRYSDAERYLTASAKALMVLAGGIKKFADTETRDGKLDSVEILQQETRGQGAKIHYRLRYKDGQTKDDDASLIVEDGEWRISG